MKTITVWHMNGVMDAGGTESLIMNIFRYRAGRINHVLIVHSDNEHQEGVYDDEIKKLGIQVFRLPSVGSVGVKRYIKEFCELVSREGHPDIIHTHLNAVGGIIAKAAKKAGIQHRIIHCHADIKYKGNAISIALSEIKLVAMKMMVNKYGTDFFACSEKAGKRLFYKNKKVIIIRNAISVEKYLCNTIKYNTQRHKLGIESNIILIGAVGRITRIKNYELIIKVVSELVKLGVDIKFICYGRIEDEKYFSELQRLCIEFAVEAYVDFLGNSKDICNDIAAFDVFVMPSFSEGLGISALEAQAAGKYCLLSTGVPKEVDVGLGLVTFIDPENIMEWIQKMKNPGKITIDENRIIEMFNKKGYNAPFEVEKIEDEYIKIARK